MYNLHSIDIKQQTDPWWLHLQVCFAMQYGKLSLQEAVKKVVYEEMDEGDGGIIAVGADGTMSVEFNSLGMFWAKQHAEGGREVGIWK